MSLIRGTLAANTSAVTDSQSGDAWPLERSGTAHHILAENIVSALGAAALGSASSVSLSGTAVDFTSIPSGVNWVEIMLAGAALSGTDNILIQVGGSGGIENSGYISTSSTVSSGSSAIVSVTVGYVVRTSGSTGATGKVSMARGSANDWYINGSVLNDTGALTSVAGNKGITGSLSEIRITRTGSDTFTAGTAIIRWGY